MAKAEEVVEAPDPDAEADKIVADAEAAAREAEGLLTELEQRVESGDTSVTREAIESAEKDRTWLRKLVAGAKSRAEAVRENARRSKLSALRQEIDAESLASGDEFVTLLANVEDAVKAFAKGFQDRNEKISEWRKRAEELRAASMQGRLVPSSDDAGIGLVDGSDADLRVGDRLLKRRYSGRILTSLLYNLATDFDSVAYFRDSNYPISGLDAVRGEVARINHDVSAVPEDARFFRTLDGGLFVTGPDHAFSAEVMQRDGLREISREEALND